MKTCPRCGIQSADDAWECECGNPFPSPALEASAIEREAIASNSPNKSESPLVAPLVGCTYGGCLGPVLMIGIAAIANDYWSPLLFLPGAMIFAFLGGLIGVLINACVACKRSEDDRSKDQTFEDPKSG